MREKTQKEQLEDLIKRPIPRQRIGIIHLNMIREGRALYGLKRFSSAQTAVDMIRPLLKQADREMVLVLSMNPRLEPMALEIVAVGGIDSCYVDVRNLFKHSLLNNATSIICFHNHPSGDESPSRDDRAMTRRISEAGKILDISLLDHIVIGEYGYYSFREHGDLMDIVSDEIA